MKIRLLTFLVWVTFALALLLTACTGGAPQETPPPLPTPTITPQAEGTPEPEATGPPEDEKPQAEVTDLLLLKERLPSLKQALCDMRDKRGLDFAMLMVTDVVDSSSRLLLTDDLPILGDLPYPKQADGTLLAEDVVSRKKQLLPVILGLLEG